MGTRRYTCTVVVGLFFVSVLAACGDNSASGGKKDAGIDAGPTCTAPQIACGTGCIDPASDENNCGSCENKCGTNETCVGGDCQDTVTCTGGQTNCNNTCKNTQDDEDNCGGCGNKCSGTQTCVSGSCQTTV